MAFAGAGGPSGGPAAAKKPLSALEAQINSALYLLMVPHSAHISTLIIDLVLIGLYIVPEQTPCTPIFRCNIGAKNAAKARFTDLSLRSLTPGEYWIPNFRPSGFRVGKRARTFMLKKANKESPSAVSLSDPPGRPPEGSQPQGREFPSWPRHHTGDAVDIFLAIHCKGYRSASKFRPSNLLRNWSHSGTRNWAK